MQKDIAGIRENYSLSTLLESDLDPDPFKQFQHWWQQAREAELPEVNAMTLATASSDGNPYARIVLLKGFSPEGFVFYTNYDSAKGRQLRENPKACLVFLWKELERQIRITGIVEKVSPAESTEYFHSRPHKSQAGAAASPQSRVIEGREWLEQQYRNVEALYGEQGEIPRPEQWGGYRVVPLQIEFWQGRRSRLHDRLQYVLTEGGTWKIERLAP